MAQLTPEMVSKINENWVANFDLILGDFLIDLSTNLGREYACFLNKVCMKICIRSTDEKSKKNLEDLSDLIFSIKNCNDYLQPIVSALPVQLLAYHVACFKGTDVDQPRNLAKSVTVE